MKKIHILLIIVLSVATAIIVSTYGNSTTYATFSEAKIKKNQDFHVVCFLDRSVAINYDPLKDPNKMYFSAYDLNNDTLNVLYLGSKPFDFEKSEQIVVTGSFNENFFIADKILLKCPSKYNEENKTRGLTK